MSTTSLCGTRKIIIRKLDVLSAQELAELCEAATQTITDDSSFSLGFSYLDTTEKERLKRYFLGALLVPEREQFICEVNGVVAGYLELLKPPQTHSSKLFATEIANHFVAPWARGNGIAKNLLAFAEQTAKKNNFTVIKLNLRANLEAAINLYEKCGYIRWGTCDRYEVIDQQYIAGHYYYKEI